MSAGGSIGARVERARKARNLSQTALAKEMTSRGHPMHQTTIWKIETGERRVRLDEAAALAAALGITLDHLATGAPCGPDLYRVGYRAGQDSVVGAVRDALSRSES